KSQYSFEIAGPRGRAAATVNTKFVQGGMAMLLRSTCAALPMNSLVEDNAEVVAKRRMPVRFARKHLLFLPAIRCNDQARAGEGCATGGHAQRADAVRRDVGSG